MTMQIDYLNVLDQIVLECECGWKIDLDYPIGLDLIVGIHNAHADTHLQKAANELFVDYRTAQERWGKPKLDYEPAAWEAPVADLTDPDRIDFGPPHKIPLWMINRVDPDPAQPNYD